MARHRPVLVVLDPGGRRLVERAEDDLGVLGADPPPVEGRAGGAEAGGLGRLLPVAHRPISRGLVTECIGEVGVARGAAPVSLRRVGEPRPGIGMPAPLGNMLLRGLGRQPQLHGLDASLEALDLLHVVAQRQRVGVAVAQRCQHGVEQGVRRTDRRLLHEPTLFEQMFASQALWTVVSSSGRCRPPRPRTGGVTPSPLTLGP